MNSRLLPLVLAVLLGLSSTAAKAEPEPELSPKAQKLFDQAAEAYSLAMDARGDELLATLVLQGQPEILMAFGWSWIHAGPPGELARRTDAIGVRLRARHAEVSSRKWQALRAKMCDGEEPCFLDMPTAPAADPVGDAAQLLATQVGAHRLLLLGEMHGTREAPELMGRLATHYAQQGPVVVVLELSTSIEAALQRYMGSDGGVPARRELLADAYWHLPPEHSDGRRNYETINLVEQLRLLRAQGKTVAVLAMDNPVGSPVDSEARDQAMAQRIRTAFATLPADGRMLVLAGGVHAMKAKPLFAPPEMQTPMGARLLDLDPYSAYTMGGDGSFWACIDGTCGPQIVRKQPVSSGEDGERAYDYRIALPEYTLARMIPERMRDAPDSE